MDELNNVSIHHVTSKLLNAIKTLQNYDDIFRNVQKLACSTQVDKNDMRNTLEESIRNCGIETELRNVIYHLVRNKLQNCEVNKSSKQSDPLSFLLRAGMQWDRRVRKSLNAMCAELNMSSPEQPRQASESEELYNKWDELSTFNIANGQATLNTIGSHSITEIKQRRVRLVCGYPSKVTVLEDRVLLAIPAMMAANIANYRPVYAPKDLLDVLLSLKGPNIEEKDSEFVQIPKWEFSHLSMKVKNIKELRQQYSEILRRDINHSGLSLDEQCQRVLNSQHAPVCQHILRKACIPHMYRGSLWAYVLDSNVTTFDVQYWNKLKSLVLDSDHIVDKLVFKDIQLTASNDDQYFVFEDVLYQIMLCFSRDSIIADIIQIKQHSHKGKYYEAPPCGIVPFHGICMFAAPFCYLYDTAEDLYFTFRAFYVRYCHRLTTINTHPQGIVSLCLLFERLLQSNEPNLWSHFRQIEIQPLRVVFKWLMRAFSGHLPPDQLLVLWDLILGFDSLEILPLFAIIILSFRKESLLQVTNLENIEAILTDLSSIKVLPLLQLALKR